MEIDLGSKAANEAMGYLIKALAKPDDGKRETVEQCSVAVMRILFDEWVNGNTRVGLEINKLFQSLKNRHDPVYATADVMIRESAIMALTTLEATKEQLKNG